MLTMVDSHFLLALNKIFFFYEWLTFGAKTKSFLYVVGSKVNRWRVILCCCF